MSVDRTAGGESADRVAASAVTGVSSMAMRAVLAELASTYEQHSGQPVAVVSAGGVDVARRVREGEAFDFVVLASDALHELTLRGAADPATRIDLARSGVAIATAAGAPRPDVSDEAAIRDAVLRARSIGYSTGPSGTHVVRLLQRWGIADAVAPRLVKAPPGIPVGALVARGDVELAFQQLSELMNVPGVEVVGLLPPAIQATTLFSSAICTTASHRPAAGAFLAFVASTQAHATLRRHGMEPA